jgi:hypothetical protein
MEYQNNLMPFEVKRIHPILQHNLWLEAAREEPLNFTDLSINQPPPLPSWFSQLDETEKQILHERLAHLELIFRTSGEEVIDEVLTRKNRQIINENYESVIKSRHIARRNQPSFEKETTQSGLAA